MKSLIINHGENHHELNGLESTPDRTELMFRAIFILLVFCALISIFFLSIFF